MRRFVLIIIYCIFLAFLAEFGIGYVGYWVTQGQRYSYSTVSYDKQKDERIALTTSNRGRVVANLDQNLAKKNTRKYSTEILHPYLGFVVDFHDEECPNIGFCDDRMRGYQSLLNGKDFPAPSPDRAIVAITGGSVAYGVANNSTKGKLEQALSTIPEFKNKEIIIYTFAVGGYKQPQQLFAIQYYLLMGAHFDMIINFDGFNDIVLPQVENIPFQTNPFFPRNWYQRVFHGVERRQSKTFLGRQAYFKEQRSIYAEQMNESMFRRSALKSLLWKLKDDSLKRAIAQAEIAYLEDAKKLPRINSKMIISGTKFETEDYDLMLRSIAQFWRRSSEQLEEVATANNIKYYHFLQPNQYVQGSKPMTDEERKIAFLEDSPVRHPYAKAAELGYPHLISEGAILVESEVAFYDLTMMFKDNREILYFDACCHFNSKGYDYIIDTMVDSINAH